MPETRSISASRWLGFGGGFANSMSGPAFVESAIFSAAVVCLLGHVHLHLVDAEFDGPTGIVLRKYVSLLSSIVATRSCPSGLWQKRNLKFPPRRPRSAAQQSAKSVDQEYAHFADGEPSGPYLFVMNGLVTRECLLSSATTGLIWPESWTGTTRTFARKRYSPKS